MSYNIILRIMNILTALREYLKKICKKFYKCTVMKNLSQTM